MVRQAGYTLLEMAIAVVVTSILIAVVLSVGVETVGFASYADRDFQVQYEANRAFHRVAEILRKVGWNGSGGTNYPSVGGSSDEFTFRILEDIDGNGHPFDSTTGDLEWGADVFRIARDDAQRSLFVYDSSGNEIWTLGRQVDSITFATYQQDNNLHFQEVQVTITTSGVTNDGNTISYTVSGSIHMRN